MRLWLVILGFVLAAVTAACSSDSGADHEHGAQPASPSSAPSSTGVAAAVASQPRASPALSTPTEPDESAEAAVRRHFDMLNKRQWGRYYGELHPAQQALVPREDFEFCMGQGSGNLTSIRVVKIIETYPEEMTIPGTTEKAQSIAIALEYETEILGRRSTTNGTFHEFVVDGQWRWVSSNPAALKRPCSA